MWLADRVTSIDTYKAPGKMGGHIGLIFQQEHARRRLEILVLLGKDVFDIQKTKKIGGVIIGKAIYDGSINLEELVKVK